MRTNEYISANNTILSNTANQTYRVLRINGSLGTKAYNAKYHLTVKMYNTSIHSIVGLSISITNGEGSSKPTVKVMKDYNSKYGMIYTKTVITSDGYVEVYVKSTSSGLALTSIMDSATDMQYICDIIAKDIPTDITEVTPTTFDPITLSDGISVNTTYKDYSFIQLDGNANLSLGVTIPTAGLLSTDPIGTLWKTTCYGNGIIVKPDGTIALLKTSGGKVYCSTDLVKGTHFILMNVRYGTEISF